MELKQHEIKNLKKWASKFFTENDLAIDVFDIDSEIDRKLNYHENKEILREKLRVILPQAEVKGKEIKNNEDKDEYEVIQKIRSEEQQALKEFDREVKELKKSEVTAIESYDIPRKYIKSVARGYNNALIFLGACGLGKSYLTRQVLAKENCKFLESKGVSSPLALYQFLYKNNHEDLVLVFDDVAGLVNNNNAFSILLGALWDRVVSWDTTSEKLKIPTKFLFKGRIIIIANKLSGENAEVVKSRCLTYNLKMNKEQKIKMMLLIAKQKHKELSEEQRIEVVDFIKKNTTKGSKFDLRTQKKIEQLYLFDNEGWEKLSLPLLETDNYFEIAFNCLKNNNSVKEAEKEFCNETNLGRQTFYNYKKKLNE